jgi:hypothetical protein
MLPLLEILRNILQQWQIGPVRVNCPCTYLVFAVWDSYEDAQRNSALADTRHVAQRVVERCHEPPTFRNLNVLLERQ